MFKTTQKGLKQGDTLAPMLLNIALEMIIQKAHLDTKRLVKRNASKNYADDIVILTRDLGVTALKS